MPPAVTVEQAPPRGVGDKGVPEGDVYSQTAKNFNIAKGDYGRKQWTQSLMKKSSAERIDHLNKIVVEECDDARRKAKAAGRPLHWDYQLVYDWGLISKDKDGKEVSTFYSALKPFSAIIGVTLWFYYAYRARDCTWQAIVLTTVLCWFTEDQMGCVLHINLDEVANLHLPFFFGGRHGVPHLVLEFRWHHIIPRDIALEPVDAVLMDMFGPATVVMLFALALPIEYFDIGGAWIWMTIKSAFALLGQLSHRSAHMYDSETDALTKFCQKAGFFVTRAAHQSHHKGDHDTDFAITNGSVNWFMTSVYRNIKNTFPDFISVNFWRVMFFVCFYDIIFFGIFINPKMTGFHDILN